MITDALDVRGTFLGGSGLIDPALRLLWFPGPGEFAGVGTPVRLRPPHPTRDSRNPIHVLMIEDDPSIADMYRFQLEHDGYRVTVATTGEIAFSTMHGTPTDIVLLDLLLPDQSGFEVLAALNERLPNHPPVVILSNYGEPSMMDRGRSLGAVDYLVKSRVTPADISSHIPGWMNAGRGGGRTDS